MSSKDHVQYEFALTRLSKREAAKPYLVLRSFLDYADLDQLRAYLWQWLKAAISGNWHKLRSGERADMLYFFEMLERLLEAVYIIGLKQRK